MDMEDKKPFCPVLDVDGVISGGKQFDLDITLPEDNRDVIYGVIKNCFKEPVCDAVVKLTEIVYNCGKEERRPIGHTFTDKEGEFVFGPLCPDRKYALQIWANTTKKIKVCAKCHHEGKCLKGDKCDKCDCFLDDKNMMEFLISNIYEPNINNSITSLINRTKIDKTITIGVELETCNTNIKRF